MQTVQGRCDDLHIPLSELTFVVVDLETTGVQAADAHITEIGAVKVRGGEVIGEFGTLVYPGEPIPNAITTLTGITDVMVAQAPRLDSALPEFLEFARGSVLVAHHAPFDVGFLRTSADRLGLAWPEFSVVDTVPLARRVVSRDEVPDYKLSSLARLFRADTSPDHRALHDARATVDVLHGLLERVGGIGVCTLDGLAALDSPATASRHRDRRVVLRLPDWRVLRVLRRSLARHRRGGRSRRR